MKKLMRITGPVTYANYDGRRAAIPYGPCTVDYGLRPNELVIMSWRRRELLFAIEMDLTELADHVAGDRVRTREPVVAPNWTAKKMRMRLNAGRPAPKCA